MRAIVNDYKRMGAGAVLGWADTDTEPAGAPAIARKGFSQRLTQLDLD
jgi:hypothetical protein